MKKTTNYGYAQFRVTSDDSLLASIHEYEGMVSLHCDIHKDHGFAIELNASHIPVIEKLLADLKQVRICPDCTYTYALCECGENANEYPIFSD